MHEHAAIEGIIQTVKAHAKGTVSRVELEVGELSPFEAQHLIEHLKERVDWEIDAIETPSLVECSCGFKGRAKILEREHDFVFFTCPACGKKPSVLFGDQIKIKKIGIKQL